MRIDDNGDPDDGHRIEINNGGGTYDERAIVDGGFLDLVRLGVLPADDPDVVGSLPELDSEIEVDTPHGPMCTATTTTATARRPTARRTTAPGWAGSGRCSRASAASTSWPPGGRAASYLRTMAAAANAGWMIPEQVWDQPSTDGFTLRRGHRLGDPAGLVDGAVRAPRRSIDAGPPVEQPAASPTGTPAATCRPARR